MNECFYYRVIKNWLSAVKSYTNEDNKKLKLNESVTAVRLKFRGSPVGIGEDLWYTFNDFG